jgi:hypothetical protein
LAASSRPGLGGLGIGGGTGTDPIREQTNRFLFSADARPRPINLPARFQLSLIGAFRQTIYDSDAAQYLLNFAPQLTQRLGPQSTFNLNYNYLRPYGFAPLLFDQSGSNNLANANVTVRTDRLRFTALPATTSSRRAAPGLADWGWVACAARGKTWPCNSP